MFKSAQSLTLINRVSLLFVLFKSKLLILTTNVVLSVICFVKLIKIVELVFKLFIDVD